MKLTRIRSSLRLLASILVLWSERAAGYAACVTGGGGFLGQELIAQLCAQDHEVV